MDLLFSEILINSRSALYRTFVALLRHNVFDNCSFVNYAVSMTPLPLNKRFTSSTRVGDIRVCVNAHNVYWFCKTDDKGFSVAVNSCDAEDALASFARDNF